MICQMRSLLPEYLDRELSPPEASRVEAHVASCAACRGELSELKAVSRSVTSLPRQPLPNGFLQRLDRRRQKEPSKPSAPLFSPPARAAAFAFSAAIIILFILPRFPALRSDEASVAAPQAALEATDELKPSHKLAPARGEPILSGSAVPRAAAVPQPAVAALRGSRSQPEDEQAAQAKLTNEELQLKLEKEKRRMGIRQIILPQDDDVRHPMGQLSDYGAGPQAQTETLAMSAAPASVGGTTPGILAGRSLLGTAVPAPGEGAEAAGFVLGSDAERAELWRRRRLTATPPAVDYSTQRLVVVVASDLLSTVEIDDVRALPDRVVVSYRVGDLPEGAAQPSSPAFQYRILPQSPLPISFERLP